MDFLRSLFGLGTKVWSGVGWGPAMFDWPCGRSLNLAAKGGTLLPHAVQEEEAGHKPGSFKHPAGFPPSDLPAGDSKRLKRRPPSPPEPLLTDIPPGSKGGVQVGHTPPRRP